MNYYEQEIDALQRWIKKAAGLNSIRLNSVPPKVPRPVILWENPNRGKDRNVSRWQYVTKVQQFGKLFVNSFDEAARLQQQLTIDLEERVGVLPIYENGNQVALLKAVEITFKNSQDLDIPIIVTYEATYTRKRPEAAPAASFVGHRLVNQENE